MLLNARHDLRIYYSVNFEFVCVIPAKAGIQVFTLWIPHQMRNDNL